MKCLACDSKIDTIELLTCAQCSGRFHYLCLNITSAYFREHQTVLNKTWACPSCELITRRRRNDNTPASPAGMKDAEQRLEDVSIINDSDISNVFGDTITTNITASSHQQTQNLYSAETQSNDNITFDRFSYLIKKEFQTMKDSLTESITKNIKQALIVEFNTKINTLKEDICRSSSTLTQKQDYLHQTINVANENIKSLEFENTKLRNELDAITKQLENKIHKMPSESYHNKIIVLYGLNEYPDENEHVLIERVSGFFHEMLGTDVNGFIEDVKRIGKRGFRRPVQIEFISKRMRNYIMDNKYTFKNTGIAVSEYMDQRKLEKRRLLRDTVKDARRRGFHPIIKHEKVFVNGNEYFCQSSMPQKQRNSSLRGDEHFERERTIGQTHQPHSTSPSNITATTSNYLEIATQTEETSEDTSLRTDSQVTLKPKSNLDCFRT